MTEIIDFKEVAYRKSGRLCHSKESTSTKNLLAYRNEIIKEWYRSPSKKEEVKDDEDAYLRRLAWSLNPPKKGTEECDEYLYERRLSRKLNAVVKAHIEMLGNSGYIDINKFPDKLFKDTYAGIMYSFLWDQKVEMRKLTSEQKASVILDMISICHDESVKFLHEAFFDDFVGMEYCYLPIELSGFNLVRFNFDSLEGYLSRFYLKGVSYDDLYFPYEKKREEFLAAYGIHNYESLVATIPQICKEYKPMRKSICQVLCVPEMTKKLAMQIIGEWPSLIC